MKDQNVNKVENNILDPNGDENNFLFLASVVAVLCESGPITVSLSDVKKYWKSEIRRLHYNLVMVVALS